MCNCCLHFTRKNKCMGRQMELEICEVLIWSCFDRYWKSDIKSLCWLLRPDSDTDNLIFVSKDIHRADKLHKWKTLVTFSFGYSTYDVLNYYAATYVSKVNYVVVTYFVFQTNREHNFIFNLEKRKSLYFGLQLPQTMKNAFVYL